MIYRFDDFELDTGNFELTRNGEELALEPKVYDLLSYLVSSQKKLVTKEELFEYLWPGQIVTEASLSNQIKEARKALGDSGKRQAFIKTVHGRGFQFLSPVSREIVPDSVGEVATATIKLLRNACPTIVVLPFQNLSSDPEQTFFCEGMSEDIITELSRFHDLRVVARYSAFQFDGASENIEELVGKLNADYAIEGSVRKLGNTVRINVLLIDLSSGAHAWGDRFDLGFDEIFAVQDHIVETAVSTIAGQVRKIETEHAVARKTRNYSAYEHLLRGLHHHKAFWPNKDDSRLAHDEFCLATAHDPNLARAHAWKVCSLSSVRGEYTRGNLEEYVDLALKALELDDTEDEVQRILAGGYHALGDLDLSEHHGLLSIHLNPNNADSIARNAYRFACLGHIDQAEAMIDRAISINPLHPGWYWLNRGMVAYCAGDYETAIEYISKNPERNGYNQAWLAACQIADNRVDIARETARKAVEFDTNASVTAYTSWDNFRDSDVLTRLQSHMRMAGLPE
jgi:TolB-like protein